MHDSSKLGEAGQGGGTKRKGEEEWWKSEEISLFGSRYDLNISSSSSYKYGGVGLFGYDKVQGASTSK